MRLFFINCLLLASVAVAFPNGHQRKDLSLFKNWITPSFFGRQQINIDPSSVLETDKAYKLYRLPGHGNILIKVMPKTPVVEEFVVPNVKPVNLNAFGSIVGTQSKENTLITVNEVNKLLSSGIPNGQYNHLTETIVPAFPKLNTVNYVVADSIKAPVIETRRPELTEVIKPYEEKIILEVPFGEKYSLQMQNNIPVMTYTAHNNCDLKVEETTEMRNQLPMCIQKRINDVVMLGAEPYRLAPRQEVYQFQPSPVMDISYPRVEASSYIQNQQRYGEMLTETFGTVPEFGLSPQPFRDGPVRYNIRPMKSQAINPHPLPFPSFRSPHLDIVDNSALKTNDNSETSKVHAFSSLGDEVKISQTLGPIPSQYIAQTSNKGLLAASKETTAHRTNGASIVATKDNVSNGRIPSYVYRYQYNPNTGKVVQVNDALKTNVKTNSSYYVVHKNAINSGAQIKQNKGKEDGLHTNKVAAKPQNVTDVVISSNTSKPKQNSMVASPQTSFKDNLTAVTDTKNDSNHQKNADGSSVSVKENKDSVSVDVKESNTKGRGDIPDQ